MIALSAPRGDAPAAEPTTSAAPAIVREDDAARVRRVVDAYYDFVWRSLRRLGVPDATAEDSAQQVFCIFAQRVRDVSLEKERSFLFGCAVRIARSERRAGGRRPEVSDDEALLAAPTTERERPDVRLEEERARATLDAILAAMPEELCAVFVLHEIEELTMAEIATILELAPGTVASRLRRARAEFEDACRAARATTEAHHE